MHERDLKLYSIVLSSIQLCEEFWNYPISTPWSVRNLKANAFWRPAAFNSILSWYAASNNPNFKKVLWSILAYSKRFNAWNNWSTGSFDLKYSAGILAIKWTSKLSAKYYKYLLYNCSNLISRNTSWQII